ncbi:ketoacyl-synthetase C-terminal extension domain-containing protein, partial [Streptomyces johnsoniae]
MELLREAREWPRVGRVRRAGVSSFGISGTNAHVIIEEFDESREPAPEEADASPTESAGPVGRPRPAVPAPLPAVPWVLSGRTPAALRGQAARLLTHLENEPALDPHDVALGLATGRAVLEHGGAVVGRDRDTLLRGLRALASGDSAPQVVRGSRAAGKTAFLFTGQGSQRVGMGLGLYGVSGVFAGAFDEVAGELEGRL